jgi:hypothetical protein
MYASKIVLLASLSATILGMVHAKPVKYQCPGDGPSGSTEKCRWEGEENRPQAAGSETVRRDFQGFTNSSGLTYYFKTGPDVRINNLTASASELDHELEDAKYNNTTTRRDPNGPDWPTKWTKKPCCQLNCACFNYLSDPNNNHPTAGDKGWKIAKCCWDLMLMDPACANPPAFENFQPIEPPWCLN